MNLWKLSRQLNKFLNILFMVIFMPLFCYGQMSMKNIFIEHYEKYPEMRIEDFYKLLFQSEFGVKHLLDDTLKSKQYLIDEVNSILPKDEPLFENISADHKVVRINLAAFRFNNYSLDSLFGVLKKSAMLIEGNEKSFYSNWLELKKLIKNRSIELSLKDVSNFEKNLCPH